MHDVQWVWVISLMNAFSSIKRFYNQMIVIVHHWFPLRRHPQYHISQQVPVPYPLKVLMWITGSACEFEYYSSVPYLLILSLLIEWGLIYDDRIWPKRYSPSTWKSSRQPKVSGRWFFYSRLVIYTKNHVQGNTGGGGANWIDLDTTVYNKSLVLTYNYAYGGATIDTSLVAPYKPTVLSLADQVNEFLTTVASKPTSVPWTSFNAIFSIWIGINNIGNTFYLSGDRNTFDDTLLNAEFALVQKLVCFFLSFQVSCLLTCFQIPVVCCCPSTL